MTSSTHCPEVIDGLSGDVWREASRCVTGTEGGGGTPPGQAVWQGSSTGSASGCWDGAPMRLAWGSAERGETEDV